MKSTLRSLTLLAATCATNALAFLIPTSYSVVEYVNEVSGNYLLLANGNTQLDEGFGGSRWVRTGYVFTQYSDWGTYGQTPVCRFLSPTFNTHFFTPYPDECEALKAPGSGWIYEGNAFSAPPPTGGRCPQVAVRRLSDGRAGHRYSADPAIIAKMLARGWIDEGIGFCAYGAGLAPEASFDAYPSMPAKLQATCEATVGPCVALAQLAPLDTRIPPYEPPFYITTNHAYPTGIADVIGTSGQDLYTALPANSPDVLRHSFVSWTGFHIVGADRLSDPYAGIHAMYQLPGVAGANGDQRVFPWRNGRERELVITSGISVKTVRRANDHSHAYGMPLIQFSDRSSGRSFYVTLQAFGTLPPGDFVGPDYTSGWAIVSTSFRADPMFGRRISGDFTLCQGNSSAACLPPTLFSFALAKADFQKVLGLARTVDPALSLDSANYFVASFRQHNETYLDAEIGMYVQRLGLQIWNPVQ